MSRGQGRGRVQSNRIQLLIWPLWRAPGVTFEELPFATPLVGLHLERKVSELGHHAKSVRLLLRE